MRTDIAVKKIETTKGDINYKVDGKGPTIVLLHPIGMDAAIWNSYVAQWKERYRLITIDMLGHGDSSPLLSPTSLSDQACAVIDVMRQEVSGRAAVVGVSMGGMVAQRVAIQAPEFVRGLVLCATAGSFPEAARAGIRGRGDATRNGSMEEAIPSTLARWFSDSAPTTLIEQTRARLATDDWHSWSRSWEAISELDNLGELAALDVPALVVAGEVDASIPVAVSRQIADAMKNARFVEVPGGSHFGAYESPQIFIPLFEQFIDTLR